jgi:hypothetical protein
MSLPYQQQRILRHINRSLRQSDPHLAAMLWIFTRICAGEDVPRWEQLPAPLPPVVRQLILPVLAIAWLADAASFALCTACRCSRRAVVACIASARPGARTVRMRGARRAMAPGPGYVNTLKSPGG